MRDAQDTHTHAHIHTHTHNKLSLILSSRVQTDTHPNNDTPTHTHTYKHPLIHSLWHSVSVSASVHPRLPLSLTPKRWDCRYPFLSFSLLYTHLPFVFVVAGLTSRNPKTCTIVYFNMEYMCVNMCICILRHTKFISLQGHCKHGVEGTRERGRK